MNITDDQILRALVGQVAKTVPKGENEHSVETIISRPMWEAFCRGAGLPEDTKPRLGCSVYGSETRIVESEAMFSFSRPL